MCAASSEFSSNDPSIIVARPPWRLDGNGYVFLYRFSPDFLDDPQVVPPSVRPMIVGGPGTVMWVNYTASNVGPYGELIFVPGQFKTEMGRYFSITKIFVGSPSSVVNGRANWGIPKQLAEFAVRETGPGERLLKMSRDGREAAEWQVRGKGPKLPVTLSVLPPGMRTLMQTWQGKTFLTTPKARGWMRRASIESVRIDPNVFPDVSGQPLLGVFEVSSFRMQFPKPKVLGEALLPDESQAVLG